VSNNQLSGCHDSNLMKLCSQLYVGGDSLISDGNNFDANWEDFCNTGAGSCLPSCSETDSLALIALYNATDGANWTNTWNLSQPMSTWFGVTVNGEGCVTELRLPNNRLSGNIPPELGDLTNLTFLNLFNNQLIGSIPSEFGNLSNLTALFLSNNQLNGTIPPELGNLTNLVSLGLGANQLSGNIPPELGNLTNLHGLGLTDNQLSGNIPSELGNLTNVTGLFLNDNQFIGSIPATIGDLNNLTDLRLSNNQLGGCYDTSLINLCSQLTNASIDTGNSFDATWSSFCNNGSGICMSTTCTTSDSLALVTLYNATNGSNWTNIWNLDQPMSTWNGVTLDGEGCVRSLVLSDNQLSGSMPPELGNLTKLEFLYLENNQLTGAIPSELGNLTDLTLLHLLNNQLSGNIPVELGNLSNLEYLILSGNQLTGTIPVELGNLTKLDQLLLGTNQLTGTIPTEIGNLINLTYFTVVNNQLSGQIPLELGNLINLESIDLSQNQLTGNIPLELTNLTSMMYLRMSDNQLTGSIPSEFGDLGDLVFVFMNDNQFIGNIPPEFGDLANLTDLSLSNNQLNGCYDANLMSLCSQLTFPSISAGNNFDVTWSEFCNNGAGICAPCRMSDSLALVALYDATDGPNWTNTWNLTQPMSTWYGVTLNGQGCVTCLDLDGGLNGCTPTQGDISGNNLVGNIPGELGELSHLETLALTYNQLSGSIPPEIGNLSNLEFLILNFNDLSGNIPPEIGNLNKLTKLYLSRNRLSGTIPSEIGNMSSLELLFLGGNQLTNEIPSSLGNLNNLNSIVLLENQLSGSIPDVLANMPTLEYLILQGNQLSGAVPDLGSLTGLSLEQNEFSHQDIAANYNTNSSINTFTFSPQYYGYEQHQQDTVGQEVTLKPDPQIPYANPSVLWLKEDSLLTRGFTLHDTTYVIPSLDTVDIGVFEYRFIDSTLTPLVEFQSLPINNYINNLDIEGEPIIPNQLIFDFTNVPEDSIPGILTTLTELGGMQIDSCGCDTQLYLYQFSMDISSILNIVGKIKSSKESADVDGGVNKKQDAPIPPDYGKLYQPEVNTATNFPDSVVVAFLDTGVMLSHQSIQNHLWINPEADDQSNGCIGDIGGHGFNFVNNSGEVDDKHGHGTGVGGLITENIPDEANIRVMPIKIQDNNNGTLFHLGCGIHYAIDNGADLINISIGYKGEKSIILENALQRAKDNGIIVVTSAGNDALNIDKEKYWPAGFANTDDFDLSNVLTVAALDTFDNFWKESNYGRNTINFAVLGQNLSVPTKEGKRGHLTGTSASAPLATLTLAIQMASDKNRSYQSVINELNGGLRSKATLRDFVKDGKWLKVVRTNKVINLDIKVLLEGAAYYNNVYNTQMRTVLHDLNLLPMNDDATRIEHPFGAKLNGFTNDEWKDTPAYSPDVVDWVLVSLRKDLLDTTTTFYKTPAWLLRDGTVSLYSPITEADIDFNSITDFYVLVEHRNHLPIAAPMAFNKSTGTISYDFTKQNAYNIPTRVGQKEILQGIWAMYAGNTRTNDAGFEDISGADKTEWSNRNGNFLIYESADINLDGDVNGEDKGLWQPNNGLPSATPE